jgi:hypothetical protein
MTLMEGDDAEDVLLARSGHEHDGASGRRFSTVPGGHPTAGGPDDQSPSIRDPRSTNGEIVVKNACGRTVLVASAAGYPLTQWVVRRFGRGGAVAVATISAGLLVRDVTLISSGAPGRLRRVPALLLWLEAVSAAVAVTAGLVVLEEERRGRRWAARGGSTPAERARRSAVAVLFGLHTLRFWIYLRPGQGRRRPDASTSAGVS